MSTKEIMYVCISFMQRSSVFDDFLDLLHAIIIPIHNYHHLHDYQQPHTFDECKITSLLLS